MDQRHSPLTFSSPRIRWRNPRPGIPAPQFAPKRSAADPAWSVTSVATGPCETDAGYATIGARVAQRRWRVCSGAERIHALSWLVDCLRRDRQHQRILPWGLLRRSWSHPSSPQPVAYPKSGWWPAPPRSPGERVHHAPELSCRKSQPGADTPIGEVTLGCRAPPGAYRPSAACSAAPTPRLPAPPWLGAGIFGQIDALERAGNSSPRLSLPYRRQSSAASACRLLPPPPTGTAFSFIRR